MGENQTVQDGVIKANDLVIGLKFLNQLNGLNSLMKEGQQKRNWHYTATSQFIGFGGNKNFFYLGSWKTNVSCLDITTPELYTSNP